MSGLVFGFIKWISPRYRYVLDVNKAHVFHDIEDITREVSQPMQEGTAVFDREAWLIDFIAENRSQIDMLLDQIEANQKLAESYEQALSHMPESEHGRLFHRVREKHIQEAIQKPVMDPKIWVKIKFTDNGRVCIVRHDMFDLDEIETCYVGDSISPQCKSEAIERPEGMSLAAFHKILADSQCACCFCGRVAADDAYLSIKDVGDGRIRVVCDDCLGESGWGDGS